MYWSTRLIRTFTRSDRLTRLPQERFVEHNSDYSKYAGQIVKETGQKWNSKPTLPSPI